jgi:hypothetical protein
MINWKKDNVHNTEEGWVGDTMYFDIERLNGTEEVIIYQMKKPLGNQLKIKSMEDAKKYCEKIINF